MRRLSDARARQMSLDAINEHGALLVYPLNNRPEPPSVWQKIHPKSPMVWEWDDDGDTRVAQLWHIRAELSASDEVVYAKWYLEELDPERAEVMEVLGSDSPQSTKQLKAALGLEGRLNEPTYNKRLKPLWTHLLLVGYGEFEDSSFPSLGIGASHTLFESLWKKAHKTDAEEAGERLMNLFGEHSAFWKWTMRIRHESLDKDSRSSYI
jgi:hypothetical protein